MVLDRQSLDKVNKALSLKTDIETLYQLSMDEKPEIRSCIASNKNTPKNAFLNLVRDREWWIRRDVATNPRTPMNLLEKLLSDENSEVREAAASHPKMIKKQQKFKSK